MKVSMIDCAIYCAIFVVVVVSAYYLAAIAPRLKLLAVPSEHRRHQAPTPMVGGLAIYLGLLLGWLFIDAMNAGLIICLSLICYIGVLDDRYALPSWSRFLAQGLITYLMIRLTGVQLHSLGVLFFSEELILGSWSVPMTIFATIGVINAVNMSDGLDGLAGSLVLIVLLVLLFIGGDEVSLILAAVCSLSAFLVWNVRIRRERATIFMGDAGSTMLGFLLSYLLIKYSQQPTGIMPVTALWLLALPLIDAVAVLIIRPLRGKSPFQADRLHYHHQLLDKNLSVNQVLIVLLVIQSLLAMLGLLLWRMEVNENGQLIAFLTLFALYCIRLFWFSGIKQLRDS